MAPEAEERKFRGSVIPKSTGLILARISAIIGAYCPAGHENTTAEVRGFLLFGFPVRFVGGTGGGDRQGVHRPFYLGSV